MNDVANYLLAQGVLGVLALVMGGIIIYQNKKYDRLQEKIDVIQEQRINDAIAVRDKIIEPMERLSALSEKIYDSVIQSRRRS